MKKFKKIINHKQKMEKLIKELEGTKIKYNGYNGIVQYVHLNGTATIYLENDLGMTWEEVVSWQDLVNC